MTRSPAPGFRPWLRFSAPIAPSRVLVVAAAAVALGTAAPTRAAALQERRIVTAEADPAHDGSAAADTLRARVAGPGAAAADTLPARAPSPPDATAGALPPSTTSTLQAAPGAAADTARPAPAPAADTLPGRPPAAADSLEGDALFQKLLTEAEPGQIVYKGDRLSLYPSDQLILLSGQARAEQDSTLLTAQRITYGRQENIIQAIGQATVERGSNRLVADTLVYDQGSGNVSTFGPSTLTEGSRQVTGENLQYSMDRNSGILAAGRTEYDRWFLSGKDMNKIGQRTFLVQDGTFTTDPADPPDYHFGSGHIKLRQDDVIIARPVVLYVSDVPIFYLPWYLEPLGQGRKSGILRPKIGLNTLINASGDERNVQDLGFYWAISDYMDAQAALDWFSRSRTILRFDYRYALRYLLRGSAHYEQVWNRERRSKDTLLRVAHDHEFNPATQFRMDANFATSRSFFEENSFDPNRILQRALRSNASLSRRFTWGNLTAGAFSDFALQQDRTDFKIPQLQLTLNTRPLFPAAAADEGWKQNLQVSASTSFDFDYTVQGDSLTGRDSTLVKSQTSVTRAALSGPFTLLGFIKTTPSVDITETLFNNDALPDSLEAVSASGFGHLETFGANVSFAGSVFRVFQGGPGPVSKVRHTLSPSLSLRYQPESTPREELPLGFPGGGGQEVLSAAFNLTNDIDVKVRESRAQAERRDAEQDRVRRAREAGLLKPRAELTLEERTRLDSMAVADSLAELDERAREDSLEQREETLERRLAEVRPDSLAVGEADARDGTALGEERAEGPPEAEEQFTERVVKLVSVRNRMGFDFVRNRDPRLLGFSTLSTDVSSQVSSAVSVSLSAVHDLTDTRTRPNPAEGSDEVFDPFLSSLNTVVRFGGGRDLPDVRAARMGMPRAAEEVTDAEAGQGAFSDGVGLGDEPPGFEAIQSSSLGRWDVDLTHTLSRQREGASRQSVRFGTSFRPTRNWALRYNSGFDLSETKIQDQTISLVRDLNRWQATLNLNVFPAEPQDRVLVEFAVYLRDIPDLRIPYRTRRE